MSANPSSTADRLERLHQRQDRLLAEIDRLGERVLETIEAAAPQRPPAEPRGSA